MVDFSWLTDFSFCLVLIVILFASVILFLSLWWIWFRFDGLCVLHLCGWSDDARIWCFAIAFMFALF